MPVTGGLHSVCACMYLYSRAQATGVGLLCLTGSNWADWDRGAAAG